MLLGYWRIAGTYRRLASGKVYGPVQMMRDAGNLDLGTGRSKEGHEERVARIITTRVLPQCRARIYAFAMQAEFLNILISASLVRGSIMLWSA